MSKTIRLLIFSLTRNGRFASFFFFEMHIFILFAVLTAIVFNFYFLSRFLIVFLHANCLLFDVLLNGMKFNVSFENCSCSKLQTCHFQFCFDFWWVIFKVEKRKMSWRRFWLLKVYSGFFDIFSLIEFKVLGRNEN